MEGYLQMLDTCHWYEVLATNPFIVSLAIFTVSDFQVLVPTLRYCTLYFTAQPCASQLNTALVVPSTFVVRLAGLPQVNVTTVGAL